MYIMDENINERDIANDILRLNQKFVDFLYYTKNEVETINNKICKINNHLDNHVFSDNSEIMKMFTMLYNYKRIDLIINDIYKNIRQVNDILGYCCDKHDFIDDYIDTTFGDNIKITYCSLCNLSKN